MNHSRTNFIAVLAFAGLTSASMIHAQTRSQVYGSSLTKQTQTFYVQGDIGITTVESDTVQSKETINATSWEFGGFAGEGREIGLAFQGAQHNIDFSLNNADMQTNWQDAVMIGRLWWLYPKVTAGLSRVKISADNQELVNFYAPTIGAGLGLYIPLWDRIVIATDYMVRKAQRVQDSTDHEVAMGNRVDGQVAISVDVTPQMFDLVFGFRHKSYELTVDGQKFDESAQGPFLGTRMGFYF
jgi:hypothetical protein